MDAMKKWLCEHDLDKYEALLNYLLKIEWIPRFGDTVNSDG